MARIKRAPEEIPDEEYEQVLERVCAIDVAKEFGQVCVRTHQADGKRVSKVFAVDATTGDILNLGESLLAQGIEMITLESTSDYWRIFYYLLEGCGLAVQLVNARDVKNVPGRPKSDKHDCVWLAKLTERGMLRPSFVPPAQVRVLRDYTRTRIDLTRDRTRHWQRLEKLLEDALIKVTTVASKITTMSVRDMIDALVRGERDPEKLADLARGVMRDKRRDLVRALDGRFDNHHAELATILLGQIDSLTTEIERLTTRIEQLVDDLPTPQHPTNPDHGTPASPDTTQPAPAPNQPRPARRRLADIPASTSTPPR
jgi:transposase